MKKYKKNNFFFIKIYLIKLIFLIYINKIKKNHINNYLNLLNLFLQKKLLNFFNKIYILNN